MVTMMPTKGCADDDDCPLSCPLPPIPPREPTLSPASRRRYPPLSPTPCPPEPNYAVSRARGTRTPQPQNPLTSTKPQ